MNKQIRNFFIIAIGLIIIIIFLFIKEKSTNNKSLQSEFAPSFKESNVNSDFMEFLDSATLVYTNYKYGVAMDFPDNWTIDKGFAEHSIIRGGQKDSGMTFTINVIELKDMKSNDITIWQLWEDKSSGLEEKYRTMLTQSVNSNIYNYSTRKVYVSNHEAIEMKFNYVVKKVDDEYEIQSISYSVYILPFAYTIGLHIPKIFYDMNPDRYNYMINNLAFVKRKNN